MKTEPHAVGAQAGLLVLLEGETPAVRTAGGEAWAVESSTDCLALTLGVMLGRMEGGDGDFCVAGDDLVWVGVDTDSVVCGCAGEAD